jgi:hypothetical protein
MKQYQGGHDETWGGVRINIDRNWLDLGEGSVTPAKQHCGGIEVDLPNYPALAAGASANSGVLALQCLFQERGLYAGKLNGSYNTKLLAATQAWQQQHGFPVTQGWSRPNWMSLLADGARHVLADNTSNDVSGPARGERHDDRDRPRRIVLRRCRARAGNCHGERADRGDNRLSYHHGFFLPASFRALVLL